jgi:hypothetical protein
MRRAVLHAMNRDETIFLVRSALELPSLPKLRLRLTSS